MVPNAHGIVDVASATLSPESALTPRHIVMLASRAARAPNTRLSRRWGAARITRPAYAAPIAKLKEQGGFVTADVIDIEPDTPNLDAMLARFKSEHWHDEDEVRFTLAGRGIFHLHLESGVIAIEVVPGDLLRVPRGTHHWFDLCSERRIRAIRLFQQVSGWAPRYTETGVDAGYAPLCLG